MHQFEGTIHVASITHPSVIHLIMCQVGRASHFMLLYTCIQIGNYDGREWLSVLSDTAIIVPILSLYFNRTVTSLECIVTSPGIFKFLLRCKSASHYKELRCNSFKLRCNFQVHLWLNILTWFGVQKPRSHFCSSFSRWIARTYFSCRKLRCDRRKFRDCCLCQTPRSVSSFCLFYFNRTVTLL